ncbi:MAG: M23 family metallopeptidase [Aquificae bacterium]|nr:M23 family metallopeptidase [Aquificota bacterium]
MVRFFLFLLLTVSFAWGEEVKLLTENFYPAGLNVIQVDNPQNLKVVVLYRDKKLTFPALGKKVFFAIPYDSGKFVELQVIRDGKTIYKKFIKVKQKKYRISRITVKSRKLTKKVLERIKRERQLIRKAFSIREEALFTENSFIPPLKNPRMSTPFGAKRIINGKKRSIHWGVDYSAPRGTPVYASLTGKVVLAKELFYTGKTVIISHGAGLFTLYAHLSKIDVKEGQMVKRGQVIGKVGSTGRSTGPHLHFGVYVNSVRTDPSLALKLKW